MKRSQVPLVIAVALDLTGFGMIIPDIQLRADGMGAPGWLIGLVLACTFMVQFLISPIWGAKSDVLGRKNVFLFCTLLSVASMVVYALASNIAWLFVSRLLAGFGAANIAVAQASVADHSEVSGRTVALGHLSAAQTGGLILGPALGGFIAKYMGSPWVGWIGAILSMIGVLAVWFFAEFAATEKVSTRRKFGFGPLVRDFPKLLPLIVLASVAWFSLATLEGTFGRLLKDVWGYGQLEFGILFSFESIIALGVQSLGLVFLTKYFKENRLLIGGYLLQGIGLAMTPFVPNLAGLFAASLFYAFGLSVANPTVNGMCSRAVSPDRQGEVFGVIQSARSIGFMAGPLLGGILFDFKNWLPYAVAGGICVLVAVIVPTVLPQGAESEAKLTT